MAVWHMDAASPLHHDDPGSRSEEPEIVATPATIAILGGDSVVLRALEALLQGSGYEIRLIAEPFADAPGEPLAGVQLLLLAPGTSDESRQRLLDGAADVPVLTLRPPPGNAPGGRERHVPWPCPVEELSGEIEAALLAASPAARAGVLNPGVGRSRVP